MLATLATVQWIFLIAANVGVLAVLCYWGTVLWLAIQTSRRVPTAMDGAALARRSPSPRSVAVVIPAHNEEKAIARLIPTLRAQTFPRLRVFLALDRCTDRTEEVARSLIADDPRFEIVVISSCPEDWSGRSNALCVAVARAIEAGVPGTPGNAPPDLLLFADSDTQFHPECIGAAAALLESRDLDLLSFVSRMAYRSWFEWVVQPSVGMELFRQYPLIKANRTDGKKRAFANGQFLLFRREAYEAVGGFGAVRTELLDDMAMARAVSEGRGTLGRPGRTGVFLAQDMLLCSMYDTWEQFRKGWTRIYIETAKRRVKRLRAGMHCALWFGTLGPWGAAALTALGVSLIARAGSARGAHSWEWWAGAASTAIGAGTIVLHVLALVVAFRIGRTPMRAIPAFTIGSLMTARLLHGAARELRTGVPVKFGGKTFVREVR